MNEDQARNILGLSRREWARLTSMGLLGTLLMRASRVSAATLATDTFTGADANPIGGNWTTVTDQNNLQRVSNALRGSTLNNRNGAYYNAVSAPADQYSQAKVTTFANSGTTKTVSVTCRVSSSGEDLYGFGVVATTGFGTIEGDIFKIVAGSFSSVSGGRFEVVLNANDVIRLEVQGTTLRAYIQGVQQDISRTDTSLATGNFGVQIDPGSGALTDTGIDDWEGGDFSGGGGTGGVISKFRRRR